MKLVDLSVKDFINSVASKEPTPGGGSVAALMCANGAALTAMVARLTIGKKAYAEHELLMQEIITKAEELKEKLIEFIDKDADAYNDVAKVLSMPKGDERTIAMQEALKKAASIPLEVMETGLLVMQTAALAIGKSNTNAYSDLNIASINIYYGLMSAYYNIEINIKSIKDKNFNETVQYRAFDILEEAEGFFKLFDRE